MPKQIVILAHIKLFSEDADYGSNNVLSGQIRYLDANKSAFHDN